MAALIGRATPFVEFVTTYDEEGSVRRLMTSSYSLKQAFEMVLPWLVGIPWHVNAERYPQIFGVNIEIQSYRSLPFQLIEKGGIFLPTNMTRTLPNYMRGVWQKVPTTPITSGDNQGYYNAQRPQANLKERVYFNSDDVVIDLTFNRS